MKNSFILKGDIIYSEDNRTLKTFKDSYLICEEGICKGVFSAVPEKYSALEVKDHTGKMIIPGFVDLHVHASQYQFRGTGMDVELMEWLDKYGFQEESKFQDIEYAKKSYAMFAKELKSGYTTRASIFATLHKEATLELMRQLDETGLDTYVGLVEMDRNSPDKLRQKSVAQALQDTEEWILESQKYSHSHPIITPRFLPSCSDELMEGISLLRKKYDLPSQSHLDENPSEVSFVMEIEKDIRNYSDGYQKFHMFGLDHKCIMAHCIYNDDEEIELLKKNGIYVAHCPECNLNVTSGIAPIAKYLEKGIHVGLGSDVAGGSNLSLLRAAKQSIQVSKMYYRYLDSSARKLDVKDAFYMLTLGGGSFFGKVGSFMDGYDFDAIVVDDSKIKSLIDFSLQERLERLLYLGDESLIAEKYCQGRKIF